MMTTISESLLAAVPFRPEDVSGLVETHLSRYSEVFTKKVNVVDGIPNSTPKNYEKKVDMSKMSGDDLYAYIRANKHKSK